MSKKSGKGKGKNDGDELGAEKEQVLRTKVESLIQRLGHEQERADRAKAAENELRARLFDLDKDFKNEKDRLFSITSDMTRQYKQMQDELLNQVNDLNKTVIEKDEEIKKKDQQIQDMTKDYEYKLKKKDDEIQDLKRKIEEMSAEFAKMLKDTLDKMQERIEMVQWDSDTDPQMMKRLKDMTGLSNN
ncbi:hypothetical protein TTHERM_00016120 (macronuclear) [Tetrahymena thermophila SB210]|uniref:Dynein regulatory complex protein 12 n=1 Tax=Tetrahymena thermophila (strain SB210) TaxID=312017 RepID=DRC12_TETTS|nr:hypothetical protein TTHERM_00016120 [Tetrahymena thermophila SB210]8TH8_S Chain S, Coiled-coil domain-containing protein 153 [Tetrahymena thermophila]8TH8_s Chain s, Coiled-coil domain-containing protein 153 [Tetrahymena thermophila]8TID_S Chain S, Coiled-coil domain-containing protein 153 [Tetrahymena thermophila]8TID_s Chain s, Coiled-coil domain-containing protein 153 [Tetrahymena thermophila]EAR88147.2 hypothetical protein TTHERM_00016120 [Tetrahymena thermophila SB210]|eukprot:XP_001008392.2 hypothetical protein TTHERM_00016120 [Tetrahymena thermophila SB210]